MKTFKYVAMCLALCASSAFAGTFTFVTPPGAQSAADGPVSASATFTTGAGSVTVVLNDLLANPTSAGQLVSDLFFHLSDATTGTLTSSSAQEITVNAGGTFTLGGVVSTGWALSSDLGGLELDVLGTAIGPAHLIIGPPGGVTYANANGSIADNGPHNPFLNQSATFLISNAAITANTTVSDVIFSFGTTVGDNVPANTPDSGSTLMLLGVVLGLTEVLRRAFMKRAVAVRSKI